MDGFATVEVWVLVDQDGDAVACEDVDVLRGRYDVIGRARVTAAVRPVPVRPAAMGRGTLPPQPGAPLPLRGRPAGEGRGGRSATRDNSELDFPHH